jgi:hypothetical protein
VLCLSFFAILIATNNSGIRIIVVAAGNKEAYLSGTKNNPKPIGRKKRQSACSKND